MHSDRTAPTTHPGAPRSLDALGVPTSLVHDLALRRCLVDGRTSTLQLSRHLAIGPVVASQVIEELRDLRHFEVQGLDGRDYQVVLTESGRQHARERMELCRYVGATPVGLAEYTEVIRSQHAAPRVTRATMRQAFGDLVVGDTLLDELGPASRSSGALFLYGPPGTGKSSIAERLNRIHDDRVLVPYAVEVDSQIIAVFDPVVHVAVDPQPAGLDPRWVLAERPSIVTGGELTGSMLDLTYQAGSGIYIAPLQMQANNGILVIDDFGRQALAPEALLNRWIVPLDRNIDYLSLDYGLKFEIPFDVKIVFSTNLDPASLGDEAFFRRIENKVLVPTINDAQFDEVLRRVTDKDGIVVTPDAAAHLRAVSRDVGDGDLRPYLPRSVCRLLRSICEYEEIPVVLSPASIDRVAALYFTHADRHTESVDQVSKPEVATSRSGQAPSAVALSAVARSGADQTDPSPELTAF